MKRTLIKFLFLLLAVPVIFVGCQKAELNEDLSSVNQENTLKTDPAYCGTPVVANLFEDFYYVGNDPQFPNTSFGSVTVGNDMTNLFVTYEIIPGWKLKHAFLYAGTPENLFNGVLAEMPDFGGPFTGEFHIVQFPYQQFYNEPGEFVQSQSFEIPRANLPQCATIVAFAEIVNDANPELHTYVSAKITSGLKHYGYYFEYCMQDCLTCETAYARGENVAGKVTRYCFYDPPLNLNNWGWTHKLVPAAGQTIEFSWPIYAGNPSCNPMNEPVGYFTGTYNGTTLHVMYDLMDGYQLDETHLWVGNDYLYKNKKKYVAAPGQYTYNNVFEEGVYHDFPASGTIYVAAHAVVCGVFE